MTTYKQRGCKLADAKQRMMDAVQAPRSGGATRADPRSLMRDAVRKAYGVEPVIVVDGDHYVRLPSCGGCRSFRWSVEKKRWYHDRDCSKKR